MTKTNRLWIAAFVGFAASVIHSAVKRERRICELEDTVEIWKLRAQTQECIAEQHRMSLEGFLKQRIEDESK